MSTWRPVRIPVTGGDSSRRGQGGGTPETIPAEREEKDSTKNKSTWRPVRIPITDGDLSRRLVHSGKGGGKKRGGENVTHNKKVKWSQYQEEVASLGTETPSTTPSVNGKADAAFNTRTTDTTRQFLTDTRFSNLQIDNKLKKSIREVMKYETLTEVQNATLPTCLLGNDVFARAKTGTGKTLAFLIPTVEKILRWRDTSGISAIVLSPTRELAMQIYEECVALTRFVDFNVQIVYGGTKMTADRVKFNRVCDLLVATPGRLQDHLSNTPQFSNKCQSCHTLILDEADQLLEVGFRDAITSIIEQLPRERQTLLFSATVAQSVRNVANIALKKDYAFIDCVGEEATVENTTQTIISCELEDSFSSLVALIQKAKKANPTKFKIVVFFITARQTQFCAEALNRVRGFEVIEIHSRKSQPQRTKASDQFRNAAKGILFSSDVSARGMDYPNVTDVIQVGLPSSREQYIHRIGRTARAGADGSAVLLLSSWEEFFLKTIKDLPTERLAVSTLAPFAVDDSILHNAISNVDCDTRQKCYSAWLGFYNGSSKKIGWQKAELVEWANWYALHCLFLPEVPVLEKKTIGKMGLKGVPGLRS